jgi:UDP-N-acetylmuramate--alanine ligase
VSAAGGAWSGRRLHLVGVGGAGMSGYARAAHALGARVSGSDANSTPYLERLAADGVLEASIGYDAPNVPTERDAEVFHSSAVPAEHPELVAASERGIPVRPRADLLGELTALRSTIAVAGTHGKTTTASMIVHALRASGERPGWLIGAPVGGGLANAEWGEGEWLVVEADESDRSMLSLDVDVAVLTNVELDHHATFHSLLELRDAFRAFLARAHTAVVVWERPELLELARAATASQGAEPGSPGGRSRAREAAGLSAASPRLAGAVEIVPYDVPEPLLHGGGSTFQWRGAEVRVPVPGAHNALNAAGALEAARIVGADLERAIAGIEGFGGAGRRFQRLGVTVAGALVYDDYAHHPTEVAATLGAARTLEPRRLVAVFQPHLYSRTALLAREFGRALALADAIVVLDVYPARERAEDHPGVSGLLIAQAAADAAGGRAVYWLPTFADAEPVLGRLLGEGDLCLAMGAGDVDALGHRLVEDPVGPAHDAPPSDRRSDAHAPGAQPTHVDDPQ